MQHQTVKFALLALTLLIFTMFVGTITAKPAAAALDKANAERLLDEFVGTCKVGSPSGPGSRCLEIALSLTGKEGGLQCGANTESGRALFRGDGKKISEIIRGSIQDCRAKIVDLPGQTKEEETAAKVEDASQEACKEFDEQREKDSVGVSVYGACKEGYKAGYEGKETRTKYCNQFTGKRREACAGAYREGNSAKPGGEGNDPSGINSGISYSDLPQAAANEGKLNTAANIAFGIAGSLAMLFVIVGGVRYIMSQGDPQKVSQAKNTILYAVAGLVVTISAFAVVRFVLERIV